MPTPAQLTPIHRRSLQIALANTQIGDDLYNKINGTERGGTLAPSSTLASVDEQALGNDHLTKLTLTGLTVATTDNGASGGFGGTKLYTFPEGLIRVKGAVVDLSFTTTSGLTTALKFSLGSIVAATNDTLNLTKANIIESTGGTITAGAGTMKAVSKATAITALTDSSGGSSGGNTIGVVDTTPHAADAVATLAAKVNELIARLTLNGDGMHSVLDGTATAIEVYLNVSAVNANSSANATVTVTGTIYIAWEWMGDK